MTLLLVAAATACMSHLAGHGHDLPHPLPCLDAQGAIPERQTPLRQFAVSSSLPAFLKYFSLIVLSWEVAILHIVEQEVHDHPLLWPLSHLPRHTLRALLAVLHL